MRRLVARAAGLLFALSVTACGLFLPGAEVECGRVPEHECLEMIELIQERHGESRETLQKVVVEYECGPAQSCRAGVANYVVRVARSGHLESFLVLTDETSEQG